MPSMHKALGLIPNTPINCHPRTQEAEAGKPEIKGHPLHLVEFKGSLVYIILGQPGLYRKNLNLKKKIFLSK